MDGEHQNALNDPGLDDALAAALCVEPSGDFKARVRARIATDMAGSRWAWRRYQPALAAALLLVASVVLVHVAVGHDPPLPPVPSSRPSMAVNGAVRAPAIGEGVELPGAGQHSVSPAPIAARPERHAARVARSADRLPAEDDTVGAPQTAVLLAPSEQEGLRLLFDSIASGRLELPPEMLGDNGQFVVRIRMIQPRDIDPFSATAAEGAVE